MHNNKILPYAPLISLCISLRITLNNKLVFYVDRLLQECLHEHGGGEVGQIWFDEGVLVFHVNFHTKLVLRKLLSGQCEVEKKIMSRLLQSRF